MSRHSSKVDWWLLVVVAAALLYPLLLLQFESKPEAVHELWFGIAMLYLIFALVALITFPVRYTVDNGELEIRSGLIRWRIKLQAIESAEPSNAPWSSPALSLDRILIRYRKGGHVTSILISPKDKDAFFSDLTENDSGLRRSENGVQRAG